MEKDEEDFPRRGIEKFTKKRKQEPDLFQVGGFGGSGAKKKKSITKEERLAKRKAKLQAAKDQEQVFRPNLARISLLSPKSIASGMLIAGVIKEIHDYDMDISLPNGITGYLPITNISSSYTELLHQLTEGDAAVSEEVCSLSELFHVGQPVRCKVVDCGTDFNNKKGKWKPKLTINPRDVNENISVSCLKTDVTLCGTIASVEDRGYVVDLGIPNVKAFLTQSDAERGRTAQVGAFRVGSYVHCAVKADVQPRESGREKTFVNLVIDPSKVFRQQTSEKSGVTMQSLQPGMAFTVVVSKVFAEGVAVKFMSYTGTIHRSHLEKNLDNLEVDQQFRAAVIYIDLITKAVCFTTLPHVLNPDRAPSRPFGDLSVGTTVDEAKVLRVDGYRGVLFSLGNKITGYASKKNLSDSEVKSVATEFKKGSFHKCRVLDFDYLDLVAGVTLRESILAQAFLKYADIEPGMVVEGKVKNVQIRGVSVSLGGNVQGFIPDIQMADIPLKHPEKFYKSGNKIRCKVLVVEPEKRRLLLTAKKSFLHTKLPTVTSYSDCQRGMVLEGFIASVKPNGVLVIFYNNVKGWVPKPELSAEEIEFPQKIFFRGQVVKCRVLACHPEQEKMVLSFKVEGKTPFGAGSAELPTDFEVGKTFNCKVVQKTDAGVDVKLNKSDTKAFIPKAHLSDHFSICDPLLEIYKEGDTIKNVVFLPSKGNVLIASRRPSLYRHAKAQGFLTDFSELKPGLLAPGSVRRVMDYGVFIDLGGGLVGLAPNKYLCDRRISEPRSAFQHDQAVVAKVTEVDHDRKRFLVSLRMQDCYHGDTNIGVNMLQDYLKDYDLVRQSFENKKGQRKKLVSHQVGTLVEVTVKNANEHGAICELEDGTKGIATEEHLGETTCEVGKKLRGVVLHADLQAVCLELSLNPKLVKAVKNFTDNKFSSAQEGQVMKCEVQLIKEEFVLVSLQAHCVGRLAYLPAKRHPNDFLERHQYVVGQVNNVVIKRVTPHNVLASLRLHEKVSELSQAEGSSSTKHHLIYKPGVVVANAVVKAVHEFQLNISLNGTPARVHVTEVDDNPSEGENPLKRFHVNQVLKVKVIGSRQVESNRPTLKGPLKRFIPECTLKQSMLDAEGLSEGEALDDRKYNIGDKVNVFVEKFHGSYLQGHLSPAVTAKVHILNCSTNSEVVKNPNLNFHAACSYTGHVISVQGGYVEVSFTGSKPIVEEGAVVQGFVLSKNPGLGVKVQLTGNKVGHIALCDMNDEYTDDPTEKFDVGQCVQCYVLQSNESDKKNSLSLRKSRISSSVDVKDPELKTRDSLKLGQVLRGYVTNCSNQGIFVSLSRDVSGRVRFQYASEFLLEEPEKIFKPGKVVTVKVLSISKKTGHVDLSMLPRDTGVKEVVPKELKGRKRQRKNSDSKEGRTGRKRRSSVSVSESSDSGVPSKKKKSDEVVIKEAPSEVQNVVEEDSEDEDEVKVVDQSNSDTAPRLSLTSGFTWDDDFKVPLQSGDVVASDSDSSGDEAEQESKKKKPRTRAEKKQLQREEERRLSEREKQLLDTERAPEVADDFDRLVLQSPNSSMVWMRYMAFHLETAEIEKARAVAERALKTISFREEQEKLNVWVAFLNLENMYGTHESLTQVFERALQHNEPLKVYQQLITIYIHSDKLEAAEQLHNTIVKRFGQNKEAWISFGQFYFHNKKIDQARKLMQRSLKSLETKHHVEVLSKFAQMEFKLGEPERGKTMFENILNSYPKRTDLWSIYIDMTVKQADVSDVRQLFERVIHMNFSAKKMKFFFKKYLDFEEKFGTEEDVSVVKQKAVEYVQSKAEDT